MRATGCWELSELHTAWRHGGLDAVAALMAAPGQVTEQAVAGAAESRSTRPVMTRPPVGDGDDRSSAGGMARPRRVLVHPSGFRQSPYADIKPPGDDAAATRQAVARQDEARRAAEREGGRSREPPRKLWHSSPGSSGR